jgi:hypothetical protein
MQRYDVIYVVALMSAIKLLAISGKLGTGKTTLETLIAKHHATKQIAFADGLKESYMAIFPGGASPYTSEGKAAIIPELEISVGKFLQDFGEAGRQYNPSLWLYSVGRKVAHANTLYIVTDCRFPNEVAYVQKLGGKVIRLERDNVDPAALAGRDSQHVSETALDNFDGFDLVLRNNGTLAELEATIVEWLNTL